MIEVFSLLISLASLALGCQLSGQEIGKCVMSPLLPTSFCSKQLSGYICVPAHNVLFDLAGHLVRVRRLVP